MLAVIVLASCINVLNQKISTFAAQEQVPQLTLHNVAKYTFKNFVYYYFCWTIYDQIRIK
jgi:hypothetical protein